MHQVLEGKFMLIGVSPYDEGCPESISTEMLEAFRVFAVGMFPICSDFGLELVSDLPKDPTLFAHWHNDRGLFLPGYCEQYTISHERVRNAWTDFKAGWFARDRVARAKEAAEEAEREVVRQKRAAAKAAREERKRQKVEASAPYLPRGNW